MPRINFHDSGHQTPAPLRGARFLPFDREIDRQKIHQLNAAIRFIESQLVQNRYQRCEAAFRSLRRRRSFSEIWRDPRIWLSYTLSSRARGFTHPLSNDIAISIAAFSSPILWRPVAATLIHELAHINGASLSTRDAEDTLLHCRFADQHDPHAVG